MSEAIIEMWKKAGINAQMEIIEASVRAVVVHQAHGSFRPARASEDVPKPSPRPANTVFAPPAVGSVGFVLHGTRLLFRAILASFRRPHGSRGGVGGLAGRCRCARPWIGM